MSGQHPFVLVTGNANKLAEATRILGYQPIAEECDLPEIQSLDVFEVLAAKSSEAWSRIRRPVVVEETELSLTGLNGFPGPLVKWMLQAIGAQGIARLAVSSGDSRAVARCALQYRDADLTVTAHGATHGRLISEPSGTQGFGWDPVFVPDEEKRTYAELSGELKDEIGHRGRAWRALQEALDRALGSR